MYLVLQSLTLQKNSWCGDDRDSWLFDPRSTTGQTADAARSSDQQYGSSEPAEEVPGGTGPSVANAAAASAAVAAISTTGAVGHSSKGGGRNLATCARQQLVVVARCYPTTAFQTDAGL